MQPYQTGNPSFRFQQIPLLALLSLFAWWVLWRIALQPAFVLSGQARYEIYRSDYVGHRFSPHTSYRYLPGRPQDKLAWTSFGFIFLILAGWSWSVERASGLTPLPRGWVDLDLCTEKLWQQAVDDPEVKGLRLTIRLVEEGATANPLHAVLCNVLCVTTILGSLLLLYLAPPLSGRLGGNYFILPALFLFAWFGLLQIPSKARFEKLKLSFSPREATLADSSLELGCLLVRKTTLAGCF